MLHSTLFFNYTLAFELKNNPKRGKFDYNKAKLTEMNAALEQTNWDLICDENTDLDTSVKLFNEVYWSTVVQFVPYVSFDCKNNNSKSAKSRPKWLTNDIKHEISLKFKLFAVLRSSSKRNRPINAKKFNKQCRVVKKLIKAARIEHETKLSSVAKSNPKMLYSYINNQSYSGCSVKLLIDSAGQELTDLDDITSCLNKEFEKSFMPTTAGNQPKFEARTDKICTIDVDEVFSPLKVKTKLEKLNKNKSPGPDGIHPLILNKCSESLCFPLSVIFKKSFEASAVPSAWKYANVSPLFKKGLKTTPSNYRPISLTAVLCKIEEGLVRDAMLSHLTSNNLLSVNQHGFVVGKSCATNLIESLDIITEALNRGFYAILVLLDFAKAFDSIVHDFLLI
jgi:hypothetical protein